MALQTPHKQTSVQLDCHSPSIGASPIAANVRAQYRGTIQQVGCVTGGVITTADASVAVAINGTAVTGATIAVTTAGAAASQHFSANPTGANFVNSDDVITFTPSLASGANIPGSFYAVIRMG